MKIKPEQTEQIASLLMASFKNKQLMVSKAPETMIKQKVVEVVTKNFTEEEEIEEEARKMLASVAPASRDMDPFKMFLLAKQKLAARKGFIL
jgi:hypothetical protein